MLGFGSLWMLLQVQRGCCGLDFYGDLTFDLGGACGATRRGAWGSTYTDVDDQVLDVGMFLCIGKRHTEAPAQLYTPVTKPWGLC